MIQLLKFQLSDSGALYTFVDSTKTDARLRINGVSYFQSVEKALKLYKEHTVCAKEIRFDGIGDTVVLEFNSRDKNNLIIMFPEYFL